LEASAPSAIRSPNSRGALRNGVGHHAIQADGGEQQREAAENADERHGDHLRRRRTLELLLQGDEFVRRDVGVERADFAGERCSHGLRSERRADVQDAAAQVVFAAGR